MDVVHVRLVMEIKQPECISVFHGQLASLSGTEVTGSQC